MCEREGGRERERDCVCVRERERESERERLGFDVLSTSQGHLRTREKERRGGGLFSTCFGARGGGGTKSRYGTHS